MNGVPRTIEEMFSGLLKENASKVVAEVKKDLSDLIKNCLLESQNTASDLCTVDRRGTHIFQPFFPTLIENGFKLSSLGLRSLSEIAVIRTDEGDLPLSRELIIAVDAINRGNEINKALEYLSGLDNKVVKIIGYVIRKETKDDLKKKHPGIELCFAIEAEDDTAYYSAHDRLTTFYHSRLVPLDSEHTYGECDVKCSKKRAEELIREAFLRVFKASTEVIESEEKLHADSSISKYSIELIDTRAFENEILPGLKRFITFERVQVRVKMRYKAPFHKLNIMVFCSPHILDMEALSSFCKEKNFMSKECNVPPEGLKPNICCSCLEGYYSSMLLKYFKDEFLSLGGNKDIDIIWYI